MSEKHLSLCSFNKYLLLAYCDRHRIYQWVKKTKSLSSWSFHVMKWDYDVNSYLISEIGNFFYPVAIKPGGTLSHTHKCWFQPAKNLWSSWPRRYHFHQHIKFCELMVWLSIILGSESQVSQHIKGRLSQRQIHTN